MSEMKNQIFVATREDLEQLIDKAVRVAFNQSNAIFGKKKELDIMNVEQVSEFLGLSTATIYDKTSRNLIPFKKKGNKLYFIRKEIERWVLDGDVKTREELDAKAMDYILKNSSNSTK